MWPFTSTPPAPPASADKCPVDHSTRAAWLQANPGATSPFHPKESSPPPPPTAAPASPAQTFVQSAANTTQDSSSARATPAEQPVNDSYLASFLSRLSNQREVSSIPRYESTKTPEFSPNGEQTVSSTARDTSTDGHTSASADGDETHWVYPSEQQFFLAMMRKHAAKVYRDDMPPPKPEDMRTIVPIHNAVNERAWHELMGWERGQGGEKCGGVRLVSFKGRPKDRTPKAWLNVALG
jgi:cytochrome c heme-lyase